MLSRIAVPTVAVLLAAPAGAHAMTFATATGSDARGAATVLAVTAAPGERNDLVVSQQTDASVLLTDPGAAMTPSGTCVSAGPSAVRCTAPAGGGIIERMTVDLGDGDDRLVVRHATPTPTTKPITGIGTRLGFTADGGPGDDDLTAGEDFDRLDAGEGNDALHAGSASASLDGGPGDDRFDGQDGVWTGGPGNDVLTATGRSGVSLAGGPGDDRLTGADGRDGLQGDGGRDVLVAGAGDDALNDGDGRAFVFGSAPGLQQRPVDRDLLDGGPGTDDVSFSLRARGVIIDLGRADGQGEPGEDDRVTGIENASGTARADRIVGTDGPNRLIGGGTTVADGPRRDLVQGRGGDDVLYAYDGARMEGGAGDDLLRHIPGRDRRRRATSVSCGGGKDLVWLPPAYTTLGRDCEEGRLVSTTVLGSVSLRDGVARLAVTCGGSARTRPCRLRLRLRRVERRADGTWSAGGYALGSSAITTIAPRTTRTLRAPLGPTARAALRRAGSLTFRVTVQTSGGGSLGSFVVRRSAG